jgi:hypothetical protein
MKKAFLLSAVLLFIIGSVLFLSAYFFFNQYSIIDSHNFSWINENWQSPSTPIELHEGDKITIKTSKIGRFDGDLFIVGTNGKRVLLSNGIGNGSVYYYVQEDDFYYCYIDLDSWTAHPEPHTITLNITVVSKAPNLLFLLIGVIVLLAGAVTIPVAFLRKSKNEKEGIGNEGDRVLESLRVFFRAYNNCRID